MGSQTSRMSALNPRLVESRRRDCLQAILLSSRQSSHNFVLNLKNVNQKCVGKKQEVFSIKENYERTRIQVHPPPSKMASQSVILPGLERIRACGAVDNPQNVLVFPDNTTRSVADVLHRGLLKSQNGKCLGTRSLLLDGDYNWINYAEVAERTDYVGSGLISLGISASQDSKIGICTKTRAEFVLTMMATSRYSMILVPMYECLESEALLYIITEGEMPIVICDSPKIARIIIQNAEKLSHLKHLILIQDSTDLKSPHLNIMTFTELEKIGKSNIQKPKKSKPEDIFCICYTSGTTGCPKGVMFSHRNILSCIASMEAIIGKDP